MATRRVGLHETSPTRCNSNRPLKIFLILKRSKSVKTGSTRSLAPYNKMGRSATDIEVIDCKGKFGPFDGQWLANLPTLQSIRFLEKVNGQYQGACFPFMDGFPSAVLRLKFSPDGTLFVGMSNRGWSSLGNKSYGLQKVNFTGKVSLAIKEIRATPTGFDLELTKPVPNDLNVKLSSFTYRYSRTTAALKSIKNPTRQKLSKMQPNPRLSQSKWMSYGSITYTNLKWNIPRATS